MTPFSLRHNKALVEQRIRVTMNARLRMRLWMTIQKYNRYVNFVDSNDRWSQADLITETESKLKRLLGESELKVRKQPVGIKEYFMDGYPSNALEVIEQFAEEVAIHQDSGDNAESRFQKEVNDAMVAFDCPWWLSERRFLQIDATFFHNEIVQKAEDVLRGQGFEGAHDEFREAREDLTDGKHKDVILKAFKSFESTLKTVIGKQSGDATELLRLFREGGFIGDIPDPQARAISKQVLASLSTLRNELAGHGQGNTVIDIPRPYALLALHLAGSLNQFVLSQYLAKQAPSDSESGT